MAFDWDGIQHDELTCIWELAFAQWLGLKAYATRDSFMADW